MKKPRLLLVCLCLLAAGAGSDSLRADVDYSPSSDMKPISTSTDDSFVARSGEWELAVGGAAAGNDVLDDSLGGVNASLGYFISENSEFSVRQSVNHLRDHFNGSTYFAFDYHFGNDRLRPFAGVGLGRAYGDSVENTWASGIEGGLKFYVRSEIFVFGMANYVWLFDHASDGFDRIDDGHVLWSVGVGYSF